jgi:Protein of unknown function (DUF3617)
MRTHWILIAALVTSVICHAQTQDVPKRKPGLWEIVTSSDRSNSAARTVKMCTDEKTGGLFSQLGDRVSKGVCSRRDVQNQGSQIVTDSVCTIAKSQVTSHTVMTFDSPTSFTIEVHSRYEPALFGKSETSSTQVGKWVGACPSDMKAGDVLTPTGTKINLNTMLESKAAATEAAAAAPNTK